MAAGLLVPFLGIILFLTLRPGDRDTAEGAFECIICGTRGLADVLLNIILFLPVGVLSTLAAGASLAIIVGAAVFSAGVEIAQFWIPGRDASIPDLLFNTTGAMAGVLITATAGRWIRPNRVLGPAATMAVLVLGLVFATGWLTTPRIPTDARWFSFWNAELDHLETYDGRVQASSIGPVSIEGNGWVPTARRDSVHRALVAGEPVRVRTTAGPPPPGVAGLFGLYDENRVEVMLIGPDGDDVVARLHLRSEDVLLDKPDVRLRGVLARYRPGDVFEITMSRTDGNYCIAVDAVQECGLGMDVSLGWTLLLHPGGMPAALMVLVRLGWCFGIAVLLGFYARSGSAAVLTGLAWILAFVVAPAVDPWLLPTPWPAFGAAIAGYLGAGVVGFRLSPGRVVVATGPVQHAQARSR